MKNSILYNTWCSSFSTAPTTLVNSTFQLIVDQYNQKHRHYHTLKHVNQLLDDIRQLRLIPRDRSILTYAAFFHDVIYDPKSEENEIKSAALARSCLQQLNVDSSIINSTCRTILSTHNHQSENELSQLFIDMDLKILASKVSNYLNYVSAIRKEYCSIPFLLYRQGRVNFLKRMLTKATIFQTHLYRSEYEQKARKNLALELSLLN